MKPLPDPTTDVRWVPVSLMSEYTGLSRWSLWNQQVRGEVPPGCTKRFGRQTRWCPAVYFAQNHVVGSAQVVALAGRIKKLEQMLADIAACILKHTDRLK